ncbi:MAG: 50S ribosomal protein L3 [Spirochaetales bacterium]|nr:50S ribosomal protein L3 [Spirochaetales bacterium]MCF7937785.1 50S ribosomal protein L3 [Spirochaetales bacterium]
MVGLLGKKLGMTQVFDENGRVTPVTVLQIEPNLVVGERTRDKNGYNSVILGAEKGTNISKPVLGQFPDGTEPRKEVVEVRDFDGEYTVGESIGIELFDNIRYVDVVGLSKGKGYQGVMKRHGFSGGRKTHGSKFHRANGSTGLAASPSKVFKGTKMPGRMGHDRVTMQNLQIVRVDQERGVLFIKGSVPGVRQGFVLIKRAKKKG